MNSRAILISAAAALVGLCPAAWSRAGTADAGTGAIVFHVTVSGKIHDSGTITVPATLRYGGSDFNGCGIIKEKANDPLGPYTFNIRVNDDTFLLGGWQKSGALDLSVANYRPNVTSYGSPKIGGKFAINGHLYGASVNYSTVHIQNGGLSGTYSDRQANRLRPGSITPAATGLTFQASWHCSTVYHLNAP